MGRGGVPSLEARRTVTPRVRAERWGLAPRSRPASAPGSPGEIASPGLDSPRPPHSALAPQPRSSPLPPHPYLRPVLQPRGHHFLPHPFPKPPSAQRDIRRSRRTSPVGAQAPKPRAAPERLCAAP